MSMRDRIAEIISEAECGDDRGYGPWVLGPDTVADAILATIKASVPELEWMRNGNHWAGGYGYVIRNIGSQYTLTIRNQHGRQFDTIEDAKAAAQAHHVAQLTGWMGK